MLPLAMVSATELGAYRLCRRRWLYDREQKFLPKTIPTARWLGSAGHRALERYHGGRRTADELMAGLREGVDQQVADLIENQGFCREAVLADVDANYGTLADLLSAYEDYDKEVTQPEWSVVETERRYHIELAPDLPPLTGQLDLLVRIGDALVIVDHKFYGRAPDKRSLHLDTQISAYFYIVWKVYKEFPTQAILNVLVKKKPSVTLRAPKLGISPWQGRFIRLQTERSREAIESFEWRTAVQMREMLRTAQQTEKAYPNPSWACPSCDYYNFCLEDISGALRDSGSMPWEDDGGGQ